MGFFSFRGILFWPILSLAPQPFPGRRGTFSYGSDAKGANRENTENRPCCQSIGGSDGLAPMD
jgi:hypothetical protein